MRRIVCGLIGVIMLGACLAACSSAAGPAGAVHQYLEDWGHQDYAGMATVVDHPPKDFVSLNRSLANELDLKSGTYQLRSSTTNGPSATAMITSHLTLAFGSLAVHNRLHLTDASGSWKVEWSPASVLPQFVQGDSVSTQVSWPSRAAILGANSVSLTTQAPLVTVGIEGSRATDPAALTVALVKAGATPPQAQSAEFASLAHPTWFIPVITVSQAAYELLKPIIYSVPGTVFETSSARTALTPELGAHLVGTVGPVTAQELSTLGLPYATGDLVGQSGIEQAYQQQLAGMPGAVIRILHGSTPVATLARFAARPGTPVRTTIDPGVQMAAESALSGETLPADIVAIQASTGDVLASVSTPDTQAANESLVGAYPPGSTFKVVTASDLIEHGLSPASPATCPATLTVDGESFHNFEGETTPSLSMEQAFAMSCNTAFIGLAGTLPDSSFASVASQYGIGTTLHLGLAAFGGKVPVPTATSDAAATAIGQAQVAVSPLSMATVTASIDSGQLRLPQLVSGAADDSVPPTTLNPTVVADLRTMMQAVVTSPIGAAANAGLPAGTFGKTGTAEFGTANPPQTDAWFIGYRGDVAFAVLVVGGGVGGAVAAPIAAKFLTAVGTM